MKSKSHIGFWLIAILVAMFVFPLFVSADTMYGRLVQEVLAIQSVFGVRVGSWIVESANTLHGTFLGTGTSDLLLSGVHNERDLKDAERYFSAPGKLLATSGSAYLTCLVMQFYSVITRIIVVLTWSVLLLPFVGAAIYDGICTRSVKYSTFGYQNPTAFALGTHAVILISVIPAMYIVIPFTVSPLFMPLWALASAVPLAFAVSHMQPVFTK